MKGGLASQLRLVREACASLAAGSEEREAAATGIHALLAELIAEDDAPPAGGGVEAERRRLLAIEEAVRHERRPGPAAQGGADAGIDLAALRLFLAGLPGEESVELADAQTVSRGMSKKTVLATLRGAQRLPARIALRIDRSANNYLGTTVVDEYPILELLWANGARIPEPFALEPTGAAIGDPFIVFAAVPGGPVGGNYVSPPRNPALVADVAACLAAIHRVAVDRWPRADQPQGTAFIDAEIEDHRRDWARLGETSSIVDACFDWIDRHRASAYGPPTLTHNDYNFNNMLVEGDRVAAVVDWEFAHVGTPASDLGYFFHSAENVSSFDAFLAAYASAGGTVPPRAQLDFYILWGQLRLAVMGFKAVRSLEEGRFDDVRFATSRWHRRQGLLRLAGLLDERGA